MVPSRLHDDVMQIDPKEGTTIKDFRNWTAAARYAKEQLLPNDDTRSLGVIVKLLRTKDQYLGYRWRKESEMREEEHWNPVPPHAQPGMFAMDFSDLGRLRRRSTGRLMRMYEKSGTRYIAFRVRGGMRVTKKRVALIIAASTHGPKPAGSVVIHLDGDRRNTRPDNLGWDPPAMSPPVPLSVRRQFHHPLTITTTTRDQISVQYLLPPTIAPETPKAESFVRFPVTSETIHQQSGPMEELDLRTFIDLQRRRIEGERYNLVASCQMMAVRHALADLNPTEDCVVLDVELEEGVLQDLKANGLDLQKCDELTDIGHKYRVTFL